MKGAREVRRMGKEILNKDQSPTKNNNDKIDLSELIK